MRDATLAHEQALQALEAQRDAFDRYARLLNAQQAALQAGDLSLVDSLTERTGSLLREILAHSSHFNELYEAVALSGDPGREEALRPLLSEVVRRAQQASAGGQMVSAGDADPGGGTSPRAPETGPARPPAYDERRSPTGRKPVIDRRG